MHGKCFNCFMATRHVNIDRDPERLSAGGMSAMLNGSGWASRLTLRLSTSSVSKILSTEVVWAEGIATR